MRDALTVIMIITMLNLTSTAFAADSNDKNPAPITTTSQPPNGASTYPCWDMMKDGHTQHMYGMMDKTTKNPPPANKTFTCWDMMDKNGNMQHMRGPMMWGAGPK